MTTTDPTHAANPSDSVLMTLARAAMQPDATLSEATWPRLDLSDPRQREFGDYELLEEIGRGGMGVVYRARQRSLDRDVAIKFIAAGIADSFNVARFLGEARAAARLLHPNIVPVHEVGSIDGVHYFSMPLIKGRTLASLLEAGMLAPGAAVTLLLKLCDAIGYAHRLGLLHLDLKPANVLLDERDEPLIADFGLARHMDDRGGVDAQEVSGTPSFMAPEQILIKQYRLTPATDLYALGAILYRCLGGVSPHGNGAPNELTQRAVAGRVRPLREVNPRVPPDIAAITMKCLELMPGDRYHSVIELADDLRRYRDGLPVSVRRIGGLERAQRWFKREPKLAMASLSAALAMVLGIAATTWQWQEANAQRDLALAQRDKADELRLRAEDTSALGAWLFAQHTSKDLSQNQDAARAMLTRLRELIPADPSRQADVLTAFTAALKRERPGAAGDMLIPLVQVMGSDYRRQVVDALTESGRVGNYALALRLAWFDEQNLESPEQFVRLLEHAIQEEPGNLEIWHIAAVFCQAMTGKRKCNHPQAAERLVELDPDNAYHWLLLAQSRQGEASSAALAEAARRRHFDDHFRETWSGYMDALRISDTEVPELLAGPTRIFSPDEDPRSIVALVESSAFPLTNWQWLVERCNPASIPSPSAATRSDCQAVALAMARSKASLVARQVGANMARRLARGTPLEQEMLELRRHWVFVRDTSEALSEEQEWNYPLDRFVADIRREGELEAWAYRLEYYGFPSRPPVEWQPDNPRDLMLPEERAAPVPPAPPPTQSTDG